MRGTGVRGKLIRYLGVAVLALLANGCTDRPAPPSGSASLASLAWREVSLPDTAAGQVVVRDVAACPGHWYIAGGYRAADASTTPALWSTVDGRDWRPVPVQPKSVYGPQHLLSAVACRGDTVVAIGSAPGGAHGNLRTNTWIGTGSGPLTEVPAAFELFGGPQQIGVGQLAAGPTGWLIGGARTGANGNAGAAVWVSADGASFQLVDNDPALESDSTAETVLSGVCPGPGGGFVAVGSAMPAGNPLTRQALAWRSPDGLHWTREQVPVDGEDADIEAVVPYGDGLLALGVRGGTFGAWLDSAAGWRAVARFGSLGGFGGPALPRVTSLVTRGGTAYAVASDGTRYRLWRSTDARTWSEVAMPAQVPAGGAATARLASLDGQLVLAADGARSHVWMAALSPTA
jgi:hypothetical protein